MEKNLEAIKTKALLMDLKLAQAEKDLAYLEEFLSRFKSIRDNMRDLENYYFYDGTWLEERELLEEKCPDFNAGVFSEDGIYNAHVAQYDCVKQILKEAAISIAE